MQTGMLFNCQVESWYSFFRDGLICFENQSLRRQTMELKQIICRAETIICCHGDKGICLLSSSCVTWDSVTPLSPALAVKISG